MSKIQVPRELIRKSKSGADLYTKCKEHFTKLGEDYPAPRTTRRIFSLYKRTGKFYGYDDVPEIPYKPVSLSEDIGEVVSPESTRGILDGKRFVFTCAQSDTPVHTKFFETLLTFCKENDARLVIGGITYNAKRARGEYTFDERIHKYIRNVSTVIADGLTWCGELNMLPTAVNPLSGLDSYTIGDSGIIPHTKVNLKSLPSIDKTVKMQMTTGAVTVRNYIPKKAGHKASFHHVYGATYVEIDDDGDWFARQLISGEDGSFYDLDRRYSGTEVTSGNAVSAITFGDLHFPHEHDYFWKVSKEMIDVLSPEHIFLHDVYDFHVRSHHNRNKLNNLIVSSEEGRTVEEEFVEMLYKLARLVEISGDALPVAVYSNHNYAFDRWLLEADYKKDPANARFFVWCLNALLEEDCFSSMEQKHLFPAIIHALLNVPNEFIPEKDIERLTKALSNVRYLDKRETFPLFTSSNKPLECGIHGHMGTNGSRGTPRQFTRIGLRANTGHTHSAGIIDGVYTAGTSTDLYMAYNFGPSTWSNSHIVTYKNGKRTIVTCNKDKWKV